MEWVNGEAMSAPWPGFGHQLAVRRTANLLETALPDLLVVDAVTLRLAPDLEPIPDVTVTTKAPDGPHLTDVPVAVAEIVSPDTWAHDAVVKSAAYLWHGVGQYWLVDPMTRSIHVFENDGGRWQLVLGLDDRHSVGRVSVGPFGTVDVDLAAVLGPGG